MEDALRRTIDDQRTPVMSPPIIIGITGTIGAGKGTAVSYLVQEHGFVHYAVRDYLVEAITAAGLPINRDTMREVGNSIRAEQGPAYIVAQLYLRAKAAGKRGIVESIRGIGEAEYLRAAGAPILAIDADRKLRFERVRERRSATDDIDFDTFVRHEELELASTDPSGQNLIGVIALADYRIENDGTPEELNASLDTFINTYY